MHGHMCFTIKTYPVYADIGADIGDVSFAKRLSSCSIAFDQTGYVKAIEQLHLNPIGSWNALRSHLMKTAECAVVWSF